MSQSAPDRDDIIAMLAAFGDRSPAEVAEQIGSLELTWLITKVEQEFGATLELSDEDMAEMTSVSSAVLGIRRALEASGHA